MEVICSTSSSPLRLYNSRRDNFADHLPTSQSLVILKPRTPCKLFSGITYRCIERKKRVKRTIRVSAAFERFTERAVRAVVFSQQEAKASGKNTVGTHHVLLGLIREDRDPNGFLGSGIRIDRAREVVKTVWNEGASVPSDFSSLDTSFSPAAKRVFEAAVEYSRALGYHFISPEHIAIGLFTVDDNASKILSIFGVDSQHLAAIAIARLQGELTKDGRELPTKDPKLNANKTFTKHTKKTTDQNQSALTQFCFDLTSRAGEGGIDPVIGRDSEMERMVQILCRRTKNNPILLGESGVGKTAIAEGLANLIARAEVPHMLMAKRVMSLDVGLLIAGAKERGELESRVTRLIKEVTEQGNVILFIDEVHTIVGTGTAGRGLKGTGFDIANLLKPALARGEFNCIASTTVDEFRSFVETDKALARRFQPLMVHEPSEEDAVTILLGLRDKYESYHKCKFTLSAINAAVELSRYIADRHLPDKAIDLIDEAGSRARMQAYRKKKEQMTGVLSLSPEDYWQEIRTVQAMHRVVANHVGPEYSSGDAVLAVPFHDEEDEIVTRDDIAEVASLWSGIPVQQITADERMLLIDLENQLKKRVIGQDEGIAVISRALKRSRVGLKNLNRPVATMLFCGPTGVGKTELTKALAACYFGSESSMIRLDMSEYMESHSVSKLIGAPPGYVGYGEGGTLTEAARKQPFSLILLDEIEKAHPTVFNIFLQIFEDGHLTDSQGRKVSFKNSLIILTSNIGSTAIAKGGSLQMGFMPQNKDSNSYSSIKSMLMEELGHYFRPELLNRLDEIVVFRPLDESQMLVILNLMLREVKERLSCLEIQLQISDSVKKLVCCEGYDEAYGARPMRRAVTRIIEDPLSEAILGGQIKSGDSAVIDLDENGNTVVFNLSSDSPLVSDVLA